ncbi:helix-turn-helix transcriptional regulator [Streptomyces durbertensis]|uniref:Helix-turn-helix transcriptional regulator n=1 Tax=Streptomyces durbertensis TaxID=2448886 RepID=A0ABR6EIS4_9ACTN|nr:LuxR C-terminal-related transcriptional regulator [Streptomyces durbertensis]MBB1244967.1 helix-turn-helix transcriptional regulator [Streptomyces durbertensis]
MTGDNATGGHKLPETDINLFSDLPMIGEQASRIYRFTVGRRFFSKEDIADGLDLQPEEADKSLQHLLQCRLIRRLEHDSGRYEVVPPDQARTLLLGAPVRSLNRLMQQVDTLRAEFAKLVPIYEASLARRMSSQAVEIVPDLTTARDLISELSARCEKEVLTAQPGGARPREILEEAAQRTIELLERGVRMRTLYQYSAQFDNATLAFTERMAAKGAEVRAVPHMLNRVIVFDGEAALIEHHEGSAGAVLVHDPSVVAFLAAVFEQHWLSAKPLLLEYDREHVTSTSDKVKQEILRLFIQGEEDKVISRRLGMSTRTCQRHLSDIMRQIGARNRAHAGYLISERGLLTLLPD